MTTPPLPQPPEDPEHTPEDQVLKRTPDQPADRLVEERWPHPLRRFWWDLLPGWLPDRWVPPAGGVRPPPYGPPSWLAEDVADTSEALEQAKRGHDLAVARAQTVEAKADRLAGRALTLLALAFALAGWQLRASHAHGGGWWYVLLAPAAAAIAALAVAGIMALELDRPGVFFTPKAQALHGRADRTRARVETEERARQRATWTAERKYDNLLAARAWFSRGLVALLAAALVATLILGLGESRPQPTAPATGGPATTRPAPSPTTRPAVGSPLTTGSARLRLPAAPSRSAPGLPVLPYR